MILRKIVKLLLFVLIAGCNLEPVERYGCTNPQACNYDTDATIDNNICYYLDCVEVCDGDNINVVDIRGNECGCGLEAVLLDSDDCCSTSVCNGEPCILDECGVCGGGGSNCICDVAEDLTDCGYNNDGNIICSDEVGWSIDLGNYVWDDGEEFTDANENGIWDDAENCYKTIQIGDQLWMAENLNVSYYNNGEYIQTGYTNEEWVELSTGAYSFYNNTIANADIYGKLYNWYSLTDERGICPAGWHVPTNDEYIILTSYLGGVGTAGGTMKGTGTIEGEDGLWHSPNQGATNESGFTALPGGQRRNIEDYLNLGELSNFWSSTEHDNDLHAWQWTMSFENSIADHVFGYKTRGFSVRCIQD